MFMELLMKKVEHRYAVGVLPSTLVTSPFSVSLQEIGNVEQSLAALALENGRPTPEAVITRAGVSAQVTPWAHAALQKADGLTLFYEEDGWKPGTTYHFKAAA